MNVYAETKQEFIKYNNARELFKELYNVTMLFKNSDHWYYCYCRNLRAQKIKCGLCKFDDCFDDKYKEKFIITYRNDVEKLQEIVDIYWSYVQIIKEQDKSALDFFCKEYVWTFRDYRQCIDSRSELDQIIDSNEEIINKHGLTYFFKHYI